MRFANTGRHHSRAQDSPEFFPPKLPATPSTLASTTQLPLPQKVYKSSFGDGTESSLSLALPSSYRTGERDGPHSLFLASDDMELPQPSVSSPSHRSTTEKNLREKEPHWLQMEEEQTIPANNMFAVFSALMLCVFAAALDQSVVAPALPTIAAELHATAAGYSYVFPIAAEP